MALPMRLVRTWRTRCESPPTIAGTESPTSPTNLSPLDSASSDNKSTTLSTIARTLNSMSSISSFPASIFEKSRMSLTISMSASPELRRVSA